MMNPKNLTINHTLNGFESGHGWSVGNEVLFGGKRKGCFADLGVKLARSSASSKSNRVFVSGFSPSLEQFSMKSARFAGLFLGLPASISSDQALVSTGVFAMPLACSQAPMSAG